MELIGYVADAELVRAFQNETRSVFGSFFLYRSIRRPLEGLRLSHGVEVRPYRQQSEKGPHERPKIAVERPTGRERDRCIAGERHNQSGSRFLRLRLGIVDGNQAVRNSSVAQTV